MFKFLYSHRRINIGIVFADAMQTKGWQSLFKQYTNQAIYIPFVDFEALIASKHKFDVIVVFSWMYLFSNEIDTYIHEIDKVVYLKLRTLDGEPKPSNKIRILRHGNISAANLHKEMIALKVIRDSKTVV